ncbi:MAG: hypothetical protein DMG26_01000 [Acidobacteria bacterium]|nr:MAG: hypothetical protein DMG25_00695 [Acidobacteriota bacterium]PYV07189.1 MAG: hypothetical protein DMG26_01000 [Acidobacteriota bacterium]PYV26886.1 MAG: hypothetical protein DMG27_05495 [Acidobacteriota bacterium]
MTKAETLLKARDRTNKIQDYLTQAKAALLNAQREFNEMGETEGSHLKAYVAILHKQIDLLAHMLFLEEKG